MPIYEYECEKCGEKFEMKRGFSDSDEDVKCPKCKAPNPTRSLSLFSRSGGSNSGCTPAPSGG